jgi:hypothetical protein
VITRTLQRPVELGQRRTLRQDSRGHKHGDKRHEADKGMPSASLSLARLLTETEHLRMPHLPGRGGRMALRAGVPIGRQLIRFWRTHALSFVSASAVTEQTGCSETQRQLQKR